jgi:hypothetical protein
MGKFSLADGREMNPNQATSWCMGGASGHGLLWLVGRKMLLDEKTTNLELGVVRYVAPQATTRDPPTSLMVPLLIKSGSVVCSSQYDGLTSTTLEVHIRLVSRSYVAIICAVTAPR